MMLQLSLLLLVGYSSGFSFKTAPTISAATSTNYHNNNNNYNYIFPHPHSFPFPPTDYNHGTSTSSSSSSLPFVWQPNFQAFCRGETDIVCLPNAFEPYWIQDLKWDACRLKQDGYGDTAGVAVGSGNKENQTIRRNVHQIWLSSPDERPRPGQDPPRDELFQRTNELARTIQRIAQRSNSPNSPFIHLNPSMAPELSYLFYEPGSFYQKHVDTITTTQSPPEPTDRQVSFILYLGHDNDERVPYNMDRDGGALRVYPQQRSGFCFDVPPVANTLVLFNSAKVPHAVMEPIDLDFVSSDGSMELISII